MQKEVLSLYACMQTHHIGQLPMYAAALLAPPTLKTDVLTLDGMVGHHARSQTYA